MCGKRGIVCLLTSDFDTEKYPIPPRPVKPSRTECNHTPMPEGYLQWHEWARQAYKTHRQIHCPKCGCLSIWLPKAEANAINKRERAASREFTKAYLRHCKAEMKRLRKGASK